MTRTRMTWAALVAVALLSTLTAAALGAEPDVVPIDQLLGGDPRSEGAGPGIVGSPLAILAAVVLLGLATAAVTLVIARLSQRD